MATLTKAEQTKLFAELGKKRNKAAPPFADDTKEKKAERIAKCRTDIFFFAHTYLPHYFENVVPAFHEKWAELATTQNELVLIAAPRGHAKSTFFTLLLVLHWMVFGARKFIIVGSDTETQAINLVAFVREELAENRRIISDYGTQKKQGAWADGDIVTRGGVRLMARGKGQGLRGLRNGPHRPDAFVGDDIENDAEQKNPRRIEKTLDWLRRVVMPSMNPAGWSVIIVGTLLSRLSALSSLMGERNDDSTPMYLQRFDQAVKPDGLPLWPSRFSLAKLAELKKAMGNSAFNAEYQNDPRDETEGIQQEWIVDYPADAHDAHKGPVSAFALYTDPSVGETTKHDFKATIALVRRGKYIDVYRARIRQESISAMVASVFEMYELLRETFADAKAVVGFESNGFQAVLKDAYEAEEDTRGYRMPLQLVNNSTNKMLRIEALFSPIERGLIRFDSHQKDQKILIEQLLFLSSGTVHDDGPDAMAGAVALMERGANIKTSYDAVLTRRASPMAMAGRQDIFAERDDN